MSAEMNFANAVVCWQAARGRHDLPWQHDRDPYRVWLSEIMLQQTQVQTVLAYFKRFLRRFPDVATLAQASLDDVLSLWSGLGYYSRARNLHRCAQVVMQAHGGVFPQTATQLQSLPGIGPSTAAAVASICFGERVAILDGNVKRVLTRYLGFDHDLSQAASVRGLLQHAQRLLPTSTTAMPSYTQGVMDLGATLCTLRKPDCLNCPLAVNCQANLLGEPSRFPVKTRKLKRSAESWWLMWAVNASGAVWLCRQPTPGVWAGLHSFSMFDSEASLHLALAAISPLSMRTLPSFKHVLTHKDLYLHPVHVNLSVDLPLDDSGVWVGTAQLARLGLPAPIKKLLQNA
jgi:A/G-specific adenine glycosylase